MKDIRLGFAMCGSFCTFSSAISALKELSQQYSDITPIMSQNAYKTDTRFGKAAAFAYEIEEICGKPIVKSIAEAEPIGPKGQLDILVVAPCTGNTLAKIAKGIADTSVTLAVKAHLRNDRPVLLGISTNDGLSGNAGNIGALFGRKHIYFVPFYQDDPKAKPNSLIADLELLPQAIEAALEGRQIQPLLTVK